METEYGSSGIGRWEEMTVKMLRDLTHGATLLLYSVRAGELNAETRSGGGRGMVFRVIRVSVFPRCEGLLNAEGRSGGGRGIQCLDKSLIP